MTGIWPDWQRPWWILLLPVLLGLLCLLWKRRSSTGHWQRLLPAAFHPLLLQHTGKRNDHLPKILLSLGWILAFLALLGPSWQQLNHSNLKATDPLVVILELTPKMLSADLSPSRLEQARRKLLDLLAARQGVQTAIIVYAGSAHNLVPLSDDINTSRNLLEALKPSLMPVPGQRADLAVEQAVHMLRQARLGQGRILLISSGVSPSEREGIHKALGRQAPRLLILGVGTAEGAPVIQEDGSLLKDQQGRILVPKLNARTLARFAQERNSGYTTIRIDDGDLRQLGLLTRPNGATDAEQSHTVHGWIDQGYWLLLPLLLLAACAGRRGWLLCLPLLLGLLPQTGYAFSWQDLWLRPDQQGQRLMEAQQPLEAAERFSDSRWQGLALYQGGNYAAAAERFSQSNRASDHYNRGNALAKNGELEGALDAYDQALYLKPDLEAAKHNKALIEQLLQQQQQNDPPADASPPSSPDTRDDPGGDPANTEQPPAGNDQVAADPDQSPETGDTQPFQETAADTTVFDSERQQELEQWLQQIPDDPGELLRRKFWYEQQKKRQERLR